jgi:hypothetical protein
MTTHAWLLLAASLPGREASTARVRLWRMLKDLGAVNLRDGVTLVPESDATRERLDEVIAAIEEDGGSAWLFDVAAQQPKLERRLIALFDRGAAYAELEPNIAALRKELPQLDEVAARRRLQQIHRNVESVAAIDFFPAAPLTRARDKLAGLAKAINRRFSPAEPTASSEPLVRRDPADYRGRVWATRKRLWVDRVASAWLIRRFIDSDARFVWLDQPADCPANAHGFDFDGAEFTHSGERVTFEVLVSSFGLNNDARLARVAALVHFLDVGGEVVPEAAGFEAVLAGLRDATSDDDELLAAAAPVLDALYRHFGRAGA